MNDYADWWFNCFRAENTAETKLHLDNFSAKTIFDAYKEGDSVAKQIVDKFAEYLGTALAIFTCVVDSPTTKGGILNYIQSLIDTNQADDAFTTALKEKIEK